MMQRENQAGERDGAALLRGKAERIGIGQPGEGLGVSWLWNVGTGEKLEGQDMEEWLQTERD